MGSIQRHVLVQLCFRGGGRGGCGGREALKSSLEASKQVAGHGCNMACGRPRAREKVPRPRSEAEASVRADSIRKQGYHDKMLEGSSPWDSFLTRSFLQVDPVDKKLGLGVSASCNCS